ncbi:MAG: zf-HC2 domain-containing protein [Actinobacteria bacterium]|nr:MAG: zf-HC2 domain-containing protein [Actinomycetota bacterium]
MEHREARQLLSARMDGELGDGQGPALEEHVRGCDDCRAFADGAARLRALTQELPRIEGPARAWAPPARAGRWSFRVAPALAAATVVALLVTVLGPPGTFAPPVAAAAERLTTIRTLFVDRVITDQAGTTREKIWFRAAGFLRIERTQPSGRSVEIDRPGERFVQDASGSQLQTGLPPRADILPEPLSPTIQLLGVPRGPGPTIDGIPTVRYELDLDRGEKVTGNASTITKRVTSVRINGPIAASLFAIPSIRASDAGFRARPLSSFSLRPASLPAGFSLVASGSSPDGDTALFARGALPLEVDIAASPRSAGPTGRSSEVSLGKTTGTIVDDLYALPRISFAIGDKTVTIVGRSIMPA